MKKCIIILFIILTITLSFSHEIFAYSTEQFSIYIPYSYTNNGNNLFTDNSGNNLSIAMINANTNSKNLQYNEENLNSLANSLEKEAKETFRKFLIETYSDYLRMDEIYSLTNSMDFIIKEKKITTFTNNNYKCFYFKYKLLVKNKPVCYGYQYLVTSNDKLYTLTATSNSDFLNSDLQSAIDSFTIKDFKDLTVSSNSPNVLERAALAFVSTLIIGFFYNLYVKYAKKKHNSYEEITSSNFKYCNYCGKQIDTASKFCQYCGEKIDTKEGEINERINR